MQINFFYSASSVRVDLKRLVSAGLLRMEALSARVVPPYKEDISCWCKCTLMQTSGQSSRLRHCIGWKGSLGQKCFCRNISGAFLFLIYFQRRIWKTPILVEKDRVIVSWHWWWGKITAWEGINTKLWSALSEWKKKQRKWLIRRSGPLFRQKVHH